jgi:hypothetical protein
VGARQVFAHTHLCDEVGMRENLTYTLLEFLPRFVALINVDSTLIVLE